ncbi:2-C-methyl-D-erythritol 4-phosphate cytidylyltransferase [Desulfosarcina ovata subsp. sediminis]|uniref:2-C-methyl-D-erythritol 4-phosphate cytidylyltransferase n=1 Tax=Desulfosarcina ovata subsp. sediminis TaxID=885957 RepID=A0A5K7ZH12_9BACT|nr:2-C-methyl-D-erythritol 4-phosphate cytidylyltransferase [Desulfosarcina ovata]BBO80141.1 2-C-methyl-D-erythritol 4-phosphate cytidylyltransferase [Desulfosarcina ovata subsp. sediminis]
MIAAVIVAGGSGRRMQATVRKQYLELDEQPILAHTLAAFDRCTILDTLVLVVPEDDLGWCRGHILAPLDLAHDVCLVKGGLSRQESVTNGLAALAADEGIVMIHDGVRPFVRQRLIRAVMAGVSPTGACIPAIPATDTLKQVGGNGMIVGTLDRRTIQLAQTPQMFSLALIRNAHSIAVDKGFVATDDASVAEFAGERVRVVPGDRDNIKITTPDDLILARAILAGWNENGGSAESVQG